MEIYDMIISSKFVEQTIGVGFPVGQRNCFTLADRSRGQLLSNVAAETGEISDHLLAMVPSHDISLAS